MKVKKGSFSVWYLPMVLNLLFWLAITEVAYLINGFSWAVLAVGVIGGYSCLAGVLLTVAGIRLAGLKGQLSFCVRRKKEGLL